MKKRGLVYEARISMEQTTAPVGDRLIRLTPRLIGCGRGKNWRPPRNVLFPLTAFAVF
jgi:hypothetical protein